MTAISALPGFVLHEVVPLGDRSGGEPLLILVGGAKAVTRSRAAPKPLVTKRGPLRARRNFHRKNPVKPGKPVLYIRHGQPTLKSNLHRSRWGVSVAQLMKFTELQLIQRLVKDKLLIDWNGEQCRHCKKGVLGKLTFVKQRGTWCHRCSLRGCQRYVQPHDFNPIFFNSSGNSGTSLVDQAAVLLCALSGASQNAAHLINDLDHKPVERIYRNLELARKVYVESKEKLIKFGLAETWADIEADEADIGKGSSEDNPGMLEWEQWGGILQRGFPKTLLLTRLPTRATHKRAPGPGPIRKMDWKPLAQKHLEGKNVILHTDGAKAYKLRLPGMLHDNVVHQIKKVKIGKRFVWVKPKFSKVVEHKLPKGKTLKVKAGTQIIDRFWQTLKKYIGQTPRQPATTVLARKVRSVQWLYWNKGANLWRENGEMMKFLIYKRFVHAD